MSTLPATWWVEVFLDEADGIATAHARLHTRERTGVTATGRSRLAPHDVDEPGLGHEIATARALSELADRMLQDAADEIGARSGTEVTATQLEEPRGTGSAVPHQRERQSDQRGATLPRS